MKRKDPPEAAAAGDSKRARPSTPVDDELEDEGTPLLSMTAKPEQTTCSAEVLSSKMNVCSFLSDRDRDPAELPLDDSKTDSDGMSAKRRHSRPLELDSEGEEEVDTSGKEESSLSDRADEAEAADRLSSGKVSFLKNQKTTTHCIC